MKEKKVKSLQIVFKDDNDYSASTETGLDKGEVVDWVERVFKLELAEPLITDEMARKIIKKWYNENKIVGKLRSYGSGSWLGLRGTDEADCDWKIELRVSYISLLEYDKLYSLDELIGEEE